MPRSQFDQELNKMHVDLDRMCHLVVLAIENCVTAFKEQDYELAQDIIHGDKQINDVERSIEAKCLSLILKQQPVASDLRDVSTALKISKSQVYKVLKKNRNIIKPMIKIDGKTFISNEGIKYIEEVFNKTITTLSVTTDEIGISLEEVAVTSSSTKSYENKSLEDVNLENFIRDSTKKVTTISSNNQEKKEVKNTKKKNIKNDDKTNIYVAPIDFKGKTIFETEEKEEKKLTKEQQLKLEEEKLLEKHCREVDTKLINLKERLIEKQELNKKSFFKKVINNIFKK